MRSVRVIFETRHCLLRATSLAGLVGLALALPAPARAERLPITSYTAADGLPSDGVNRIVRDSRGYLWTCHRRGLSRYDGYRFTVYGGAEGLPEGATHDLLETREGLYLVATSEGVYRFDPEGEERLFLPLGTPETGARDDSPKERPVVLRLVQDPGGRMWAGTRSGLFELRTDGEGETYRRVELPGEVSEDGRSDYITDLLATASGELWIGTGRGLVRRAPNGGVTRFGIANGLPGEDTRALILDGEGHVWVGSTMGLVRLVARPEEKGAIVAEHLVPGRDIPDRMVRVLFLSRDDTLWVASTGVGVLSNPVGPGRQAVWFDTRSGLSQDEVTAIAEDLHGNLWLGTEAAGLMRLVRGGLTSYGEAEGLENARIASILEPSSGGLCVADSERIYCLREDRFTAIRPNVPTEALGWGWYQWILEDHAGDWWIPTPEGLHRFTEVERPEDLASITSFEVFTEEDGLPTNGIFRLYEDRQRDVWIGTISPPRIEQLTRWRRSTGELQRYTAEDGIPRMAPTAFREDGRGGLWIGFYLGGVARYREGSFRLFGPEAGCPEGFIRAIHLDGEGRLWIAGTRGGVARLDDPAAETPHFEPYTTEHGLSSNFVAAITEDLNGFLYLGTDQGVDRLDPRTGAIRRYTVADGLPNSFVNTAHRDREGALWFGTLRGLARLEPRAELPSPPAAVFIDRVRVAGRPLQVSELGQREVAEARLPYRQGRVRIEFGGISFSPGNPLRYQYQLEGGSEEWSEPTLGRAVEFANLASGSYRFLVRALDEEGRPSPAPAEFPFTVLSPWWRQWWFLLLAAAALAVVAFSLHRTRVARAVELERVRTRIATDLHDDIGASLSQIAILSEVVSRKAEGGSADSKKYLARIAESSRELVDSMADIVWAINPRRDRLGDLVHRMRRFAGDTTAGDDVALVFRAPEGSEDLRLGPDLRRELYLVFKESLNNAVRHSGCSRVEVSLALEGDRLRLEVRDDGSGFDPEGRHDGNGLESMRRRAAALGGELAFRTAPGQGTVVYLLVPSRRPRATRSRPPSPL